MMHVPEPIDSLTEGERNSTYPHRLIVIRFAFTSKVHIVLSD